jgi:Protein of unknown function (DUF3108)
MSLLRVNASLLVAILLLPVSVAAAAQATLPCMPFAGERMEFEVGWEFINAGTATMTVSRADAHTYRIDTLAKTNKFFDMFKKVRDTIVSEGLCRGDKPQSTAFDLTQHENVYHAVKKTRFLWQRGKVEYTHDGKTETFDVPAGYLNVMDAFYTVRRLPLKVGDVIRLPIFDSGKKYNVEVHVLKTDHLYMQGGSGKGKRIQCLVIEPRLKTAAIFSSVGTMKIWLSDDSRRLPIQMTAKIKIGHIVARLVGYQPAP